MGNWKKYQWLLKFSLGLIIWVGAKDSYSFWDNYGRNAMKNVCFGSPLMWIWNLVSIRAPLCRRSGTRLKNSESLEEIKGKLTLWEFSFKQKWIEVKMLKTKVIICCWGLNNSTDSAEYTYSACFKEVRVNSIYCKYVVTGFIKGAQIYVLDYEHKIDLLILSVGADLVMFLLFTG